MQTQLVQLTDARLPRNGPSGLRRFWTTLEGHNPGGSIKDRMVVPELENALRAGLLKENGTVSEISAGSTALSLAYHARRLNLGSHFFIPHGSSAETIAKLQAFGSEFTVCDPQSAYAEYEKFLQSTDVWPLQQMANKNLRLHYATWGEKDLKPFISPELLIGTVGTGHSLLGLATTFSTAKCISAEPLPNEPVSGVRNLDHLNFGTKDPCERERIHQRIELARHFYFPENNIESEHGLLEVSDSFRLAVGAACTELANSPHVQEVFILGSHNRLLRAL